MQGIRTIEKFPGILRESDPHMHNVLAFFLFVVVSDDFRERAVDPKFPTCNIDIFASTYWILTSVKKKKPLNAHGIAWFSVVDKLFVSNNENAAFTLKRKLRIEKLRLLL